MWRIAAEHATEDPGMWDAYLEIIQSPAHILSEWTIEVIGGVCGVHAVVNLLHRAKHRVLRRFRKLNGSPDTASHEGRPQWDD